MEIEDTQAAVARDPDSGEAWYNLGAAHFRRAGAGPDHYMEALACFIAARMRLGDHPRVLMAMGAISSVLAQDEQALYFYSAAHAKIGGHDHYMACAEASALLRMGQWEAGWRRYEDRLRYRPDCDWAAPRAGLQALHRKKVLVKAEQGDGDTFMFARYIPLLERAVECTLVIEVPANQVSLMLSPLAYHGEVVAAGTVETSDEWVKISMLSLPLLLGLPAPHPTPLMPMKPSPDARGIGLCWAGGILKGDRDAETTDRRRSIPMPLFAPIAKAADEDAVQLQRGPGFEPRDWLETAMRIRECSLVVSVDTAVAHLAASMGVPTLLLNRYDSCWRWGLTDSKTSWYPSMTILRQQAPGDWSTVIKEAVRVIEELRARQTLS